MILSDLELLGVVATDVKQCGEPREKLRRLALVAPYLAGEVLTLRGEVERLRTKIVSQETTISVARLRATLAESQHAGLVDAVSKPNPN